MTSQATKSEISMTRIFFSDFAYLDGGSWSVIPNQNLVWKFLVGSKIGGESNGDDGIRALTVKLKKKGEISAELKNIINVMCMSYDQRVQRF